MRTLRFYTLLSLSIVSFVLLSAVAVSAGPTCQIRANCTQATGTLGQLKTFEGGPLSTISIAGDQILLEVCADNVPGNTVYASLYRPATTTAEAQVWRFVRTDITDRCTTFSGMQGDEILLPGVTYYTVASLNPISYADATAMREACYSLTDGLQLCDPIALDMSVDVS